MHDAIERTTGRVLQALGREEAVSAEALVLLLRGYAATGREDLGDALGAALGRALDGLAHQIPCSPSTSDLPEWLALLVEAAALTDDERLPAAAAALASGLRRTWPGRGRVEPIMRAVAACLGAAHLLAPDDGREIVAASVDELERVVGLAYRPGEGIRPTVSGAGVGVARDLRDHVCTASALLAAYSVTGRLPYSMLAEELMHFALRTWWDEERGWFCGGSSAGVANDRPAEPETEHADPVAANCGAARVLFRLAALHDDAEYRASAVVAPDADYARIARRILQALAPACREEGLVAVPYALALSEGLGRFAFAADLQ